MSTSDNSSSDDLDLTTGVLGSHVSENSPTITWRDGHVTVLPAVYNESNINVCEEIDLSIIRFMAKFPISTPESKNAIHLPHDALLRKDILHAVGLGLSQNKPVVIRGDRRQERCEDLSEDYLQDKYAITPLHPVCIHDMMLRSKDHVNPTLSGTIRSFMLSMTDTTKIQCILDLPLAQAILPEPLRNIDHGLVYGWNQTTHAVPIASRVHPDNFMVKGWGLLHHAGFLTYPHHDAEGTLTWTRMEFGVKFWVVFRPKDKHDNRIHLQNFATNLVDYISHTSWVQKNCSAEVIVLRAGDILILPPGTVHAVYTPVASFATGGHFYHYMCMHLTELSRYIDAEVADSTTNQDLEHALETLRRMTIMIPYLSTSVVLYKRSILGLCMMVAKSLQYRAMGSSINSVAESETSEPSADVATAIMEFLGISTKVRPGAMMYQGNQFVPGGIVNRRDLDTALLRALNL